jgi:tripeptide aminopeptidase
MEKIVSDLNKKHGANNIFEIAIKDQYFNMREKIEPVMHIVDIAEEAMVSLGIKPLIKPIRGGTDGSQLSYMGLPCPNIFAGGHNFHGRYEYVPVESMQKAVEVICKIANLTATKYQLP